MRKIAWRKESGWREEWMDGWMNEWRCSGQLIYYSVSPGTWNGVMLPILESPPWQLTVYCFFRRLVFVLLHAG